MDEGKKSKISKVLFVILILFLIGPLIFLGSCLPLGISSTYFNNYDLILPFLSLFCGLISAFLILKILKFYKQDPTKSKYIIKKFFNNYIIYFFIGYMLLVLIPFFTYSSIFPKESREEITGYLSFFLFCFLALFFIYKFIKDLKNG
ncbi:MAG: hypothetical protein WC867_03365 [Candidatus Pacearchaeota archaeon]|jgi:hypothetical protein